MLGLGGGPGTTQIIAPVHRCRLPVRIRPIRSLVPTMGSNSVSGITVAASSVHWNQNLQPYKAFNKVYTSWRQAFCLNARTGTLTISFPNQVTVTTCKDLDTSRFTRNPHLLLALVTH